MKKTNIIAIGLCVLAILATSVFATDDEDGLRAVSVTKLGRSFSATSTRLTGGHLSSMIFAGDNIAFPDWSLSYFRLSADEQAAFTFRVILLGAVEYIPSGPAGYQEGVDTLVNYFSAANIARGWGNFVYTSTVIDAHTTVYNASTTSLDGHVTLSFMLTTNQTMSPDEGPMGRALLSPTAMKINVYVNNFPWTLPTTRLALRFGFVQAAGYHSEQPELPHNPTLRSDMDAQVRFRLDSGYQGYFSWNSSVWDGGAHARGVVAGQLKLGNFQDNVTLAAGFSATEMYTSFEDTQSNYLAWDPAMGVSSFTPTSSAATAAGSVSSSAALILSAVAVIGMAALGML